MELTVAKVAELVGGTVQGDASRIIRCLAPIENGTPDALSFLHNPKYLPHLGTTQAAAVLVPQDLNGEAPSTQASLVKVAHPYLAFGQILQLFHQEKLAQPGVSAQAYISPTAKLGKQVYVGPGAYVGDDAHVRDGARIYPGAYVGDRTTIGQDAILYANASVYYECEIGDRCVIHSGAVIGADGFGFAQTPDGASHKIPQVGKVVLEADVEIGANSCVDRATLGITRIKQGAKIDDLVMIAHNCEIGQDAVIAGQCGISGSTRIGNRVMMGGQVGIAGHLLVADDVKLGAKSGVTKSLPNAGEHLRGQPVNPLRTQMRMEASLRQLPELLKQVHALQARIEELERESVS